jgi:mannose-1-phosphate guanylyltransferase/phosphomannomutase
MSNNTDCRALIMAGGRSERMRATAGPLHKALVPVCGVTLIERNLRLLLDEGFQDIVVAISRAEPMIGDFLERHCQALVAPYGTRPQILWEDTPLGTIGAAREAIGTSDALLVVNVDNLTALVLRRLIDFHRQQHAALTIASHQEPFHIPFGELVLNDEKVEQYLEKPVKPIWISSGTYVVSPEACSLISANKRTDVPELVSALLAAKKRVAAFRHHSAWIDINDASAVQQAEEQRRKLSI